MFASIAAPAITAGTSTPVSFAGATAKTSAIALLLTAPFIRQVGGANLIFITTEPKMFVSMIDVEGLSNQSHERIT